MRAGAGNVISVEASPPFVRIRSTSASGVIRIRFGGRGTRRPPHANALAAVRAFKRARCIIVRYFYPVRFIHDADISVYKITGTRRPLRINYGDGGFVRPAKTAPSNNLRPCAPRLPAARNVSPERATNIGPPSVTNDRRTRPSSKLAFSAFRKARVPPSSH